MIPINNKKQDKKPKKRSIFFIAPGLLSVPNNGGGGIENNIFNLAKNSPVSTIIFSPKPKLEGTKKLDGTHIIYSIISETTHYPLPPHFSVFNMNTYLKTFIFHIEAAMIFAANREEIDTVVVFDKFNGIFPLIIASLLGKNKVYMEYNIWPWTYPKNYRRNFFFINTLFGNLIASICSLITANSPSIRKGMILNGIESSKVFIVPTGIENLYFNKGNNKSGSSDEMHVLYAGRLVDERGADLLPRIIDIVSQYSDKIHFDIVGNGPLKDALSKVNRDYLKNVSMRGQLNRAEVIKLMNESDVCLFISKNENYGSLALLECMAAECPIIATDVGSTSEIVKNEFNGVLVNPDAESIANAIIELFNNRSVVSKIKGNCRKVYEEYKWDIVSAKFIETLYQIDLIDF